jgi:hypothetical protein
MREEGSVEETQIFALTALRRKVLDSIASYRVSKKKTSSLLGAGRSIH